MKPTRFHRDVGILLLLACCACAASIATVRHDDGTTSVGAHEHTLRAGRWTELYANGRKQSEGDYDDDVQTGAWTYWFENGNKEMEGRFVDHRRDGAWSSLWENVALRAEGRFERGFEEGTWRFYDNSGALDHEGSFEFGKPVLRWTYFDRDGSVRSSGNYLAGVKVGEWIALDATGTKTTALYPLPPGIELVEDRFGDGTLGRAGFLRDGVRRGRWISHHPSGKRRLECVFDDGEPNGRACAWREDGLLLASGSLKNGCLVGEWLFSRGAEEQKIELQSPRPRQSYGGEWSPASSADLPGFTAVETWIAEMCAPRQPAPIRVTTEATTTASAAIVSDSKPHATPLAPEDLSAIPARAQPWTEYETSALPSLVKLYSAGPSNDAEDWNAPAIPRKYTKLGASAARSEELVGRALPITRFSTADGGVIDLGELVGKRNVLVTILRGFGGQVCVYCAAQTKALAEFAGDFTALDTEIVIVYPGPASGLGAFIDAYHRTFGAGEKIPYKLLYDTDLALTRALHIEDNIAVPTSLVIDRKGIVRWCHVAKDYTDRPSAREVLKAIKALAKRER